MIVKIRVLGFCISLFSRNEEDVKFVVPNPGQLKTLFSGFYWRFFREAGFLL